MWQMSSRLRWMRSSSWSEQLARRADERFALQVLVAARSLANEHDLGVRVAVSGHDVGARVAQRALVTGEHAFEQRLVESLVAAHLRPGKMIVLERCPCCCVNPDASGAMGASPTAGRGRGADAKACGRCRS